MVLKQEARRRAVPLSALLMEMVEREASAIRSSRRPRIGVVHRPVGIADAMSADSDAPLSSEIRSR
jgi:hypothetical protein